MRLPRKIARWGGALSVILVIAGASAACGQPSRYEPQSPALTEPPPATTAPAATEAVTATPGVQAPATPFSQRVYDPNLTMYGIWDGLGHDSGDSLAALEDTVFYDDKSQAYVILEALKFFNLDVARAGLDTLTELTGEDFDFDRRRWREFVGAREEEYAPAVGLRAVESERAVGDRPRDGGVAGTRHFKLARQSHRGGLGRRAG